MRFQRNDRVTTMQTATIFNENAGKREDRFLQSIQGIFANKSSSGSKQLFPQPTVIVKGPSKSTKSTTILTKSAGKRRKNPRRYRRVVALDCEMVGVGPMKVSVLARVSIVNYQGLCLFDSFVQVKEPVTDYRTAFSGVRREDLESDAALPFGEVRARVQKILSRSILVGHGLENDLAVLHLNKSPELVRDTSSYIPFMAHCRDGTFRARRLRDLMWERLGVVIQSGEHDSVEDAWAAMSLYKLVEHEWEACFRAPCNDPYEQCPCYEPYEQWSPELALQMMQRRLCAKATAWMPEDVNLMSSC